LPGAATIVSKATAVDREAYSAFSGTNLDALLRARGAKRLFVGGLATDYCVLQTVLDARALGYWVFLLIDAIRAVDVAPDDGAKAIEEMRRAGAEPIWIAVIA
jgi:nicotinamidase/pyrazinamidase